jgi:hypothetical protein
MIGFLLAAALLLLRCRPDRDAASSMTMVGARAFSSKGAFFFLFFAFQAW